MNRTAHRPLDCFAKAFPPLGASVVLLTYAACCTLVDPGPASAGDWPQWRGPQGNSVSDEQGLPIEWSEESGIVWKTELPPWGTSTPAIWGDAIFVTTQHGGDLLLLRLDKSDGHLVWTREVGAAETRRKEDGPWKRGEQKFHDLHNNASPSPVVDGRHVVVHFGNGLLAVYDFDGRELWRRNLQEEYGAYTIWWGHANSPVLYEGLVVSVCMQDSIADLADVPAPSYLVAHDVDTGELRWKSSRMTEADAEECDSYTTPVFHRAGDRWEMIVMGGNQLDAYDPATGRQLWQLPGLVGGRTITGPTVAGDTVYTTRGMRGTLLAVPTGGSGEISPDAILWKHDDNTPDSSSPVVWENLLFIVSDAGIAQCLDAKTGEHYWTERLGGKFKASPLAAEGRIYFLDLEGRCTVVAADKEYDELAVNQLDDETTASPAVSDGRIYIRGHKSLYCLSR